VVETVRVEVAGLPPGVTALGESEQLARVRAGGNEQASDTELLKEPNCGVMVTV